MRVALLVTCLVDQCWPSVGIAAVRLLRRLGCDVSFDPRATCCGQPAFNSGYRDEARRLARVWIEAFERQRADWAVLPSGSCAAMVHHFPSLFEDRAWRERAEAMASRTRELGSFIARELGIVDVGARLAARVTWHDACHGLRELGIRDEPRALLGAVDRLELVEAETAGECCGFGGTFAVKYHEISTAILDRKLDSIEALGVDAIVSGDVSCLMHIEGRLARRGSRLRTLHLADVLATGSDDG
jgi:L-lactate dehydrogenase complex protein LldE